MPKNNKIQKSKEFEIVLINSVDNHNSTEDDIPQPPPQYLTEEMSLNRLFEAAKEEALKNNT